MSAILRQKYSFVNLFSVIGTTYVGDGVSTYKVLDPNTILSLYYTADYDGNQTPAFVIVGNPLVLSSSSSYSIYANGKTEYALVDSVSDGVMKPVTSNAVATALSYFTTEQKTGGYWIDEKPIFRKCVKRTGTTGNSQVLLDSILNTSYIDTVVSAHANMVIDDGSIIFIGAYDATNARASLQVQSSGLYKMSGVGGRDLVWAIEYTKR